MIEIQIEGSTELFHSPQLQKKEDHKAIHFTDPIIVSPLLDFTFSLTVSDSSSSFCHVLRLPVPTPSAEIKGKLTSHFTVSVISLFSTFFSPHFSVREHTYTLWKCILSKKLGTHHTFFLLNSSYSCIPFKMPSSEINPSMLQMFLSI